MKLSIFLSALLYSSLVFSLNTKKVNTYKTQKNIQQILNMPLAHRIETFKTQPSFYFKHLTQIFYSKKFSDSIRWKALMSMSRINPKKTKPHIHKALKNKSWFFKNAALIAMEIIDPEQAVQLALRFLNHPSLILRTASVEVIRRQKARQYKNILWHKLNAKENFRKGKSLWIRYTILQTLSEFSDMKDANLFFNLLKDPDPRIHTMALRTLNRLSPTSLKKQWSEDLDLKPMVAREGLGHSSRSHPDRSQRDRSSATHQNIQF